MNKLKAVGVLRVLLYVWLGLLGLAWIDIGVSSLPGNGLLAKSKLSGLEASK